ncbi:MAG: helicase HerA-like domain-containing protein [Candidatus Pacearchaeota archaeon]
MNNQLKIKEIQEGKSALYIYQITIFIIILIINIVLCSSDSSIESAYGDTIKKEFYEISRSKIEREIQIGNIFKDNFKIYNQKDSYIRVSFSVSPHLVEIINIDVIGAVISPKNYTEIYLTILGKEIKNYSGEIIISGDINDKINVNISVINESIKPEMFISVENIKNKFTKKEVLKFKVNIQKISREVITNASLSYYLKYANESEFIFLGNETRDLISSMQILKSFNLPENIENGRYIVSVITNYNGEKATSNTEIEIVSPFWSIKVFGIIPLWLLILIISVLVLSIISFVIIRRLIERSKKYKMQLYTNTLPRKGERTLWLGKVAETNMEAFLELDLLTTHAVVAGATGGGKSIAAQVIVEEALLKGVSVIVFDPTAQWSGMLRKCEDKKMLSFYPKFGLKPSDARAFPGSIKQIQNERQAIDVMKYVTPGHIQIFALNRLTPPQIDNFVATIIASIFKSDPKEHPELKIMLVFDEVHRLLPKFGGSGKGFLQIERACREFRKWGFGVMLVSQVLSDFVGEIKANINTEIQMRTRDESDLNRLKTKYGEEFLQSLIKASVGVGMFVNPKYNKGKPYFINFRPILHNTRRLSDEILEKYSQYTETIEDLEYQIEQLEAEKVDTFDLKMELKLVKDKLMTGNFTVVDIYLESLKPRLDKKWQELGKKPKKREVILVDAKEVEASIKQAEKDREEFEKNQKNENKSNLEGNKNNQKINNEPTKQDKSKETLEAKEKTKEEKHTSKKRYL